MKIEFHLLHVFLLCIGVLGVVDTIMPEAFAMGSAPSSCDNLYGGVMTSFLINNGSQTFDALANPGVVFNVNDGSTYAVTFSIHTANESTFNNTNPGEAWYHTYAPAFGWGACTGFTGPNQDVAVSNSWQEPATYPTNQEVTQSVSYNSYNGNTVYYQVHWMPTTSSSSTISSAPQNLAATAGNAQVSLSWQIPSSNGGSTITGYNIYRGTSSGGESSTPIASGITSTSFNDVSVTNGQTYYYQVTAMNSVGESAKSNEANATPQVPATAPSAPQNLAATAGNAQVSLSWQASPSNGGSAITGYNVYRGTTAGGESSTPIATGITSTSYADNSVTNNQAYYYYVTAVNSVGVSNPSNEASATPAAPTSGGSGTADPIVLNNIQSTSGTTSSSNQITLSNFNAGSGTDQLLVIGISANNNNAVSVTFNGTPLTQAVSSFYNNDAELWYLKNPSGTGNIVVTMTGQTQAVVGAYSLSGVNQTSPIASHAINHNTSASSPHISIATKYANDWVLDLPSIWGGETLNSPTCTQQWDVNVPNEITGASSSTIVSSPATATCKWTASSADFWDDVAVELRAN